MIALVLLVAAGVAAWLAWRTYTTGRRNLPARVDRPLPARPPRRRARRKVRADVPHLLYMYLWASTRRPSYFGISNDPEARHRRHGTDPDDRWWYAASEPVMYEVDWYPNRAQALAAERAIIAQQSRAGEYLANTHHNPYPIVRGR